jgi:hypothetical protein
MMREGERASTVYPHPFNGQRVRQSIARPAQSAMADWERVKLNRADHSAVGGARVGFHGRSCAAVVGFSFVPLILSGYIPRH